MPADAAGPWFGRLRCLVDVVSGASWAEGASRPFQTPRHAAFPGLAGIGYPHGGTFPCQGGVVRMTEMGWLSTPAAASGAIAAKPLTAPLGVHASGSE